jgi:hypothetical protein
VDPNLLGQASYVRQCEVLARAPSRTAFARKLIAVGLDCRSEAAVSAWVKEWGGVSANGRDMAAVTDERVYLRALNGYPGNPYLPFSPAVGA